MSTNIISDEGIIKAAMIFWLEQIPVQEIYDPYCQAVVAAHRDGRTSQFAALKALNSRANLVRDWIVHNRIIEAEIK